MITAGAGSPPELDSASMKSERTFVRIKAPIVPKTQIKSEMVRDAIRHLIEDESKLSTETIRVIEKGKDQVERGEGRTLEDVELELND